MDRQSFDAARRTQRPPTGMDVVTTLRHFAIITFCVDPDRLQSLVHPRFEPVRIRHHQREWALVSVVPFEDRDFRFSRCPWPKWRFGQTNYRLYVVDTETGEQVAWFFGTSLDSVTVAVPRRVWQLPWHRARIQFDCEWDPHAQRYARYQMHTTRSWADASLTIEDTGEPPQSLVGFDDLETGLVVLTHPLVGYYYRRDGRLGSYSIWHDQLCTSCGELSQGTFQLLADLDLVPIGDTTSVHSVLLQHETEFTIYLPPQPVSSPGARS